MAIDHLLGRIGRSSLLSLNHLLNLTAFASRLLSLVFRPPAAGRVLVRRIVFEQVYFTAVQALPVILPFALILGAMLIFQFARVAGPYDLGRTTVLLIVREFGPIATAFLVILRSATAVTVEVGYMNVLHEMEAVEMMGLDPMRLVCLPRLVGITSAVLCLFIVFDVASIGGGYALAWLVSDIPLGGFFVRIARALTGADIAVGLVKAVLFGIVITITCLYQGLSVRGQITRVPVAVSRAMIECSFYCLLINVGISVLFYV
jgi:phospholipid/cholesterol/gamma-HCH transport system permease protein